MRASIASYASAGTASAEMSVRHDFFTTVGPEDSSFCRYLVHSEIRKGSVVSATLELACSYISVMRRVAIMAQSIQNKQNEIFIDNYQRVQVKVD